MDVLPVHIRIQDCDSVQVLSDLADRAVTASRNKMPSKVTSDLFNGVITQN